MGLWHFLSFAGKQSANILISDCVGVTRLTDGRLLNINSQRPVFSRQNSRVKTDSTTHNILHHEPWQFVPLVWCFEQTNYSQQLGREGGQRKPSGNWQCKFDAIKETRATVSYLLLILVSTPTQPVQLSQGHTKATEFMCVMISYFVLVNNPYTDIVL